MSARDLTAHINHRHSEQTHQFTNEAPMASYNMPNYMNIPGCRTNMYKIDSGISQVIPQMQTHTIRPNRFMLNNQMRPQMQLNQMTPHLHSQRKNINHSNYLPHVNYSNMQNFF